MPGQWNCSVTFYYKLAVTCQKTKELNRDDPVPRQSIVHRHVLLVTITQSINIRCVEIVLDYWLVSLTPQELASTTTRHYPMRRALNFVHINLSK
jgi:hypothetical protein